MAGIQGILNASDLPAESTESHTASTSDSEAPRRTIKPWSGGHEQFILPYQSSMDLSLRNSSDTHGNSDESSARPLGLESPRTRGHQVSDSGSSASSYRSTSNPSSTHSRVSSYSTIGEPVGPTNMMEKDSALEMSAPADVAGNGSAGHVLLTSPYRRDSPSDFVTRRRDGSSNSGSTIDGDSRRVFGLPETLQPGLLRPDVPIPSTESRDFVPTAGQTGSLVHTRNHRVQSDEIPEVINLAAERPFSVSDEPRCLYTEQCKTGSQLRKAISHIFGRNKICTRQIPDGVWVHFCRKHYQRCRYRNETAYAKMQCELVLRQVRRIQAWSDANQTADRMGVLHTWSVNVRKREQNRRNSEVPEPHYNGRTTSTAEYAGLGKKRPFMSNESDEEIDPSKQANVVPQWLITKTGQGFSTEYVLDVFRQIQEEMEAGNLQRIPDIEALPSISIDPARDSARRKIAPIHRKTQSYNGPVHRQRLGGFVEDYRDPSQPSAAVPQHYNRGMPTLPPPTPSFSVYQPALQVSSRSGTGYHDAQNRAHRRVQSDIGAFPGPHSLSNLPHRRVQSDIGAFPGPHSLSNLPMTGRGTYPLGNTNAGFQHNFVSTPGAWENNVSTSAFYGNGDHVANNSHAYRPPPPRADQYGSNQSFNTGFVPNPFSASNQGNMLGHCSSQPCRFPPISRVEEEEDGKPFGQEGLGEYSSSNGAKRPRPADATDLPPLSGSYPSSGYYGNYGPNNGNSH